MDFWKEVGNKVVDKILSLDFLGLFEISKKIINTAVLYGSFAVILAAVVISVLLFVAKFFRLIHSDRINKVILLCIAMVAFTFVFDAVYIIFFNFKTLNISLVSSGGNASGTHVLLFSNPIEEVPVINGSASFKVKKTQKTYTIHIKKREDITPAARIVIPNDSSDIQTVSVDAPYLPLNAVFTHPESQVNVDSYKHLPIEVTFQDNNKDFQQIDYNKIQADIDNRPIVGFSRVKTNKSFVASDNYTINKLGLRSHNLCVNYAGNPYNKQFTLYKEMLTCKRAAKNYRYNRKLVDLNDSNAGFKPHKKNEYSEIRFPVQLDIRKDFTIIYQAAIIQDAAAIELEIGKSILLIIGKDSAKLKTSSLGDGIGAYDEKTQVLFPKTIPLGSVFKIKMSYIAEKNELSAQIYYNDRSSDTPLTTKLPMFADTNKLYDIGIAGTLLTDLDKFSSKTSTVAIDPNKYSVIVTSVIASNSQL